MPRGVKNPGSQPHAVPENFLKMYTQRGTLYYINPDDPGIGWMHDKDGLLKSYPLEYILYTIGRDPRPKAPRVREASTPQTARELTGSALGEPIPIVYGTRKVGATVFLRKATGTNFNTLYEGHALSQGPIDSVVEATVDDKVVNASNFGASIDLAYYLGNTTQIVDNLLPAVFGVSASAFPTWPNLAWVRMRAIYTKDKLTSAPDVIYKVKGRKLLDPRLGMLDDYPNQPETWSENAALALADYLHHPHYGMGRELIWDSVAEVAATCDVLVGGEKRHTCNIALMQRAGDEAIVEMLRMQCRVMLREIDGAIAFAYDGARSVSLYLNESNSAPVGAETLGSDEVANRVVADFENSAKNYEPDEAAAQTTGVDTNSVEVREERFPMDACVYASEAARQSFWLLNKGIAQATRIEVLITKAEGLAAQEGDRVQYTSEGLGVDSLDLVIDQITKMPGSHERLATCSLYNPAIYADITVPVETKLKSSLPDPLAALAAPSSVIATRSGTRVIVDWVADSSAPFFGGVEITYQVGSGTVRNAGVFSAPTIELVDIDPFQALTVYAKTVNVNSGAKSSSASYTLVAASNVLAAPTGVSATRTRLTDTDYVIDVNFTPNSSPYAAGTIIGLKIGGGAETRVADLGPKAGNFRITKVNALQSYEVRLYTAALDGQWGSVASVTVAAESGTPASPANLSIQRSYDANANTESIGVAWDADQSWQFYGGARLLWRKKPTPYYSGSWATTASLYAAAGASTGKVNDGDMASLALRVPAGEATQQVTYSDMNNAAAHSYDAREVTIYGTPGRMADMFGYPRMRLRVRDDNGGSPTWRFYYPETAGISGADNSNSLRWQEIAPGVYRTKIPKHPALTSVANIRSWMVEWISNSSVPPVADFDIYEIQFADAANAWNDAGLLEGNSFEIPNTDPTAVYEFALQVRNAKTGEFSAGAYEQAAPQDMSVPAPTGLTVTRAFNANTNTDDVVLEWTPQTNHALYGGTWVQYQIGSAAIKVAGNNPGSRIEVKGVDPAASVQLWAYTINRLTDSTSGEATVTGPSIVPVSLATPTVNTPTLRWLDGLLTAKMECGITNNEPSAYYEGIEVEWYQNDQADWQKMGLFNQAGAFMVNVQSVNPFLDFHIRARVRNKVTGWVGAWNQTGRTAVSITPPAVTGLTTTRERQPGSKMHRLRVGWTNPAAPHDLTMITYRKTVNGVASPITLLGEYLASPAEIEAVEETATLEVWVKHVNRITKTYGAETLATYNPWTSTNGGARNLAVAANQSIALVAGSDEEYAVINMTGSAVDARIIAIQTPTNVRTMKVIIRNTSSVNITLHHQHSSVPSGYSGLISTPDYATGAMNRVLPINGIAELTFYMGLGWLINAVTEMPYSYPDYASGPLALEFYADFNTQAFGIGVNFNVQLSNTPTITLTGTSSNITGNSVWNVSPTGFFYSQQANIGGNYCSFMGSWEANA